MLKAANNAQSTLAQAITATATSFGVIDGSSFPDGNFLISADDEIMLVGTRSGNTFSSVTRGHEGTTAAAHVSGTAVENRFTAGTHMELVEALIEHKNETMPHKFLNLKTKKAYHFGFQVSSEGKPQIIYEEVI